jgi:uncharacterized phage protein (TIGR02220 family)
MRNDPKVKAIRRKFGLPGYAVYCMTIEIMIDSEGFTTVENPLQVELSAGDMGVEPGELTAILGYCVEIGLFQRDKNTSGDGTVLSSRRLKQDMQAVIDGRNSENESYRRRKYTEESRVEESRVEEREENAMSGNESPDPVGVLLDQQKGELEPIPYVKIIDALNTSAGAKYNPKTDATRRFIKARWNEGYRFCDFLKVIEVKCAQWKRDPKMVSFLRPQTLFGTKFEAYLNESTIAVASIPCAECGLRGGNHKNDCSKSIVSREECARSEKTPLDLAEVRQRFASADPPEGESAKNELDAIEF